MFYPIYLDLRNRKCLVVGGGSVAVAKVRGLLEAGATVIVVAPQAGDAIMCWGGEGRLVWHQRTFVSVDVEGMFLVIAATDDRSVNAHVYQIADSRQKLANAVDDLENCNFIAPAVARCGAIQVAVSTSGKSPALAKQLRDEIAHEILTPDRERLAEFLGTWRYEVKRALPTYQQRMTFWEQALRSELPELLSGADDDRAEQYMRDLVARAKERI